MTDLSLFKQYMTIADQLTQVSSKEDLVECARLLAMNLAHYETKYGALPLEEQLVMLEADHPNQDQADLMAKGMENFVGVLGSIIQGFEPKATH